MFIVIKQFSAISCLPDMLREEVLDKHNKHTSDTSAMGRRLETIIRERSNEARTCVSSVRFVIGSQHFTLTTRPRCII